MHGTGPAHLAEVNAALRELAGLVDNAELRAEILADCADPGPIRLTARETEVLALVAAGRGNAEIAQLLATTGPAVKARLRTAMTKLGARSRHAAVSAARVAGLVP